MGASPSTTFAWVARLEESRCSGCRVCLPACDFGALIWVTSDIELLIDPWACTGCGSCVPLCPERALALAPRSP